MDEPDQVSDSGVPADRRSPIETTIWLAAEREAFRAAMNDAPLAVSLGILLDTVVAEMRDGRRCAFYVANENTGTLSHVVGMPDSYARAVDGLAVSQESLSCGLAVAKGEPVITPDILEEPRWRNWTSLAREHDYRGCWSFPIETSAGKLVGSFACYFGEPRAARAEDHLAAALVTQSAAIIISRHQETQSRRRAETALRESEQRLRLVLQSMSDAVYVGDEAGITLANQAALDQLGYATREELNRHIGTLAEEIQTHDYATGASISAEQQAFARALRGQEVIQDVTITHRRTGERRVVRCAASPLIVDDKVVAAVAVNCDITERKHAEEMVRASEERLRFLIAELQHRVRNVLSVVRSVFQRTVRPDAEMEEAVRHFMGRLDALARTQVVVTRNLGGYVDLESLIREELLSVGAGDGPHLSIEGPDISLPSKLAEPLGLAIHELTTNALKYGALKSANARLDVHWKSNPPYGEGRRLTLIWQEQGVPIVPVEPVHEGFGRELIEEALPYRLGADTKLEFLGGGIRCSISLPLPD